MTGNSLNEGNLSEHSFSTGTVTRRMVLKRATLKGAGVREVSASDFEQVRQQLTGDPDSVPHVAILKSAPDA